jgi:methyl-accepting chemotaxis protein
MNIGNKKDNKRQLKLKNFFIKVITKVIRKVNIDNIYNNANKNNIDVKILIFFGLVIWPENLFACDDINNSILRDFCKLSLNLHNIFGDWLLFILLIFMMLIFIALKFPSFFQFIDDFFQKLSSKIKGESDKKNIYSVKNELEMAKEVIRDDISKVKDLEEKMESILKEILNLKNNLEKMEGIVDNTNNNTEDINERIIEINKSVELNSRLITEITKEIEVLRGSINTLNSVITSLMTNINKLGILVHDLEKINRNISKIKSILDSLVD